jgi:hypothetical protein
MSQVPIERYTITIPIPPGASSIRLLIPFPPTSTISALITKVKKRASRSTLLPNVLSSLILYLRDAIGPILNKDDLLEDIIINSKAESITVIPRNSLTFTGPAPPSKSNHIS